MAEAANYNPHVATLHNTLFNSSFAGRLVETELVDPEFLWNREGFMTSFIPTGEQVVKGPLKRKNSSGTDSSPGMSSEKVAVVPHAPGTRYPGISVETYKLEYYKTLPYGIKVTIDESARIPSPMNSRRVRDAYGDAGRWIKEYMNMEILAGALNNFSYTEGSELQAYTDNCDGLGYETTYGFICGKLDAGTYWNTDSADYLTDTEQLKTAFVKQEGYAANLTTLLMDRTIYEKIRLWSYTNGYSWEETPIPGGRFLGRFNGLELISLNNVDGLNTTGDSNADKVIMLDKTKTPCSTYFYNKPLPGYTRWGADAKVQVASDVPNREINDLEMYFKFEMKTVLEYPKYIGFMEVY